MKNHFQNRFPELAEAFQELLDLVQQLSRPANEVLLDDVDLRAMLKVSKRTTATWRQKGLIRHSWLQGKCYYKYSDVLAAVDQHAVSPIRSQLKIKL